MYKNFIIRIYRFRLKFAHKLMTFCLDHKIDNVYILKTTFNIYNRLVRNCYILEHKEANHHYIPRFLLRKFCISGTDNIYQYTYIEAVEPVSIPKKAAVVPNLYSFRDKATKTKSDYIENQLFAHSIEKYASRILNKIIQEDKLELTYLEQSIIVSFIGFQYVRTPKFLEEIGLVLEFLSLEENVSLEEMIQRDFFKKVFFDNYYQITPHALGAFSIKNKLKINGAENLILNIAISIGDYLSSVIYKKDLRLLEVKSPGFFFLSDNPTSIFNIQQNRSVGPFLWEINNNALIHLPISPNRCLYCIDLENKLSVGIIGSFVEIASKDSIREFAYSDRKTNILSALFKIN